MDPEIEVAMNLAEELDRVSRILACEADGQSSEHDGGYSGRKPALIVWREVPGLKREVWDTLKAGGKCPGWHVCAPEERAASLASGRLDTRREERTGLWRPLPFMERLKEELARNTLAGRCAALALFSVASSFAEADNSLCAGLWAAARPGDVPGRVDEGGLGGKFSGTVGLFLPGRGIFQALALAEKVAMDADEHLARAGLGVRTRAGVAASADCHEEVSLLLRRARQALESSSRRDDATLGERVCLYREDISGEGHDVHETLVQASEKRFLFFGGTI